MICRHVLTEPNWSESFDYFNDAKDTIAWLAGYAYARRINGDEANAEKADAIRERLIELDKKYWQDTADEVSRRIKPVSRLGYRLPEQGINGLQCRLAERC